MNDLGTEPGDPAERFDLDPNKQGFNREVEEHVEKFERVSDVLIVIFFLVTIVFCIALWFAS